MVRSVGRLSTRKRPRTGPKDLATATPFDGTAAQVAAAAITARDDGRLARVLANRTEPETVGAAGITLPHWAVLNRAENACDALLADGADPGGAVCRSVGRVRGRCR